MKSKISDLYLYLARRDKSGVRIIAKFKGQEQLPTRIKIEDIASFQLPVVWYNTISQIIYDNRMLWEPFIQSIDTFENFRNNMKSRGYTNIPLSSQPEFTMSTVQSQYVNLNSLPKITTMIRKN
jgi:hypothetical protein